MWERGTALFENSMQLPMHSDKGFFVKEFQLKSFAVNKNFVQRGSRLSTLEPSSLGLSALERSTSELSS